jgi:hypothetical protein
MTLPRLLKWGSLTAGVAFLAAGYALIHQWWLLGLAVLVWLGGIFADKWSVAVFVGMVGLAAAGVYMGAATILVVLGATSALASWDLASWEDFVAGGLPAEAITRLEWRHYAYLALALGAGLLAVILGRLVRVQLPFGVLLILAVLVFLGVDQVWRFTKK